MIEHIQCENKYGYDNNEYLIEFWEQIQSGWNPFDDVDMTKDFYSEVKDNKEDYPKHIVALCGLPCVLLRRCVITKVIITMYLISGCLKNLNRFCDLCALR